VPTQQAEYRKDNPLFFFLTFYMVQDLGQKLPNYVLPTKSPGWPDLGQTTALHSHTLYQYSYHALALSRALLTHGHIQGIDPL
jgi:hypothetical protein